MRISAGRIFLLSWATCARSDCLLWMQSKLDRLFSQSVPEASAFIEACALTLATRGLLALLPFRIVLAWLSLVEARGLRREDGSLAVSRIRRAVKRAATALPGKSSCLACSIAGRVMLSIRGVPSQLRIGVRDGDSFEAHAWLQVGDLPVSGIAESKGFTELMKLS